MMRRSVNCFRRRNRRRRIPSLLTQNKRTSMFLNYSDRSMVKLRFSWLRRLRNWLRCFRRFETSMLRWSIILKHLRSSRVKMSQVYTVREKRPVWFRFLTCIWPRKTWISPRNSYREQLKSTIRRRWKTNKWSRCSFRRRFVWRGRSIRLRSRNNLRRIKSNSVTSKPPAVFVSMISNRISGFASSLVDTSSISSASQSGCSRTRNAPTAEESLRKHVEVVDSFVRSTVQS